MTDAHLLIPTGDFFLHQMRVGRYTGDRASYCSGLAQGRRVLHVGCVDSPIFNPNANLHIILESVCAQLDGLDADRPGLELLRPYVKGRLFGDFSEVTERYDLMIVPEVVEHVDDHVGFFRALDRVDCDEVLITVPCASNAQKHGVFQYDEAQGIFQEFVHPDHRVWYSPFTLYTTIKKYTPWRIEEIFFLSALSVAARCSRTRADTSDRGEAALAVALG